MSENDGKPSVPSLSIDKLALDDHTEALPNHSPDPSQDAPNPRVSGDKSPPQEGPAIQLTGKQEHYLKRELVSEQVRFEISELNSPTALRRFGAPFKSPLGEISPLQSELPILRYIFVHHIRDFPFLDRAREKEFWQDKLQTFLESFATKEISSSEDRLEETKRRKLALKFQKLIELMIVSGVPTASNFEERIRFSDMEIVDRGAIETGVLHSLPEGNYWNGWDVNVAAVRQSAGGKDKKKTTAKKADDKKTIRSRLDFRSHKSHCEYIIRVKRKGELEYFVARRYRDFVRLHHDIRLELPGKYVPILPPKNRADAVAVGPTTQPSSTSDPAAAAAAAAAEGTPIPETTVTENGDVERNGTTNAPGDSYYSSFTSFFRSSPRASNTPVQDDTSSESSINTNYTTNTTNTTDPSQTQRLGIPPTNQSLGRSSTTSLRSGVSAKSQPKQANGGSGGGPTILLRENQRISLRAFLRQLLHNPQMAETKALQAFLTKDPIQLTDADVDDIEARKRLDELRVEEQKRFYEIARQRAAELDVYMESFRRSIVDDNGLVKLFQEIREKKTIADLSLQYRKFAEWLRIEVAATIYHLFLAEDNSPELFAQARRIHSLMPYSIIKNVIRVANPAAVMSRILDVFLAQPFGARSLMQRIFSLTLHEGIKSFQRSIDPLVAKIACEAYVVKLRRFTEAPTDLRQRIRREAKEAGVDVIVAALRSDELEPALTSAEIQRLFHSYVAFNRAVDEDEQGEDYRQGAQLFSYLKQLLKVYTRQRDKQMMLSLIEEPVTFQLFKDLFTIFYEPLVRVYKAANVYNSVTDFADFFTNVIQVVEQCQQQDVSADPNVTVQAFIDLCQRHEDNFYKFVHEVHIHDDGLFVQLMEWIEGILKFLRHGPANGALDIQRLMEEAVRSGTVDRDKVLAEVNSLIAWQEARKQWHHAKTQQKMAAELSPTSGITLPSAADLGLANLVSMDELSDGRHHHHNGVSDDDDDDDDDELDLFDDSQEEEEDELDPVVAERRRRARRQDRLRRRAGEPEKPHISEIHKLKGPFGQILRQVLAN